MMRLGDLLSVKTATGDVAIGSDGSPLVNGELTEEMIALRLTGVSADSRTVEQGHIFVAVSGSQTDGARFVVDAVEAGALAVLVEESVNVDAETLGVPVLTSANPRRALALIAAAFYPRQPKTIVAVTGTAGKTSVAHFCAQIFKKLGLKGASIGTLGVMVDGQIQYGGLTTPDPVGLHRILDRLARDGVTHLAMEASSHGLDQHRLDGVRLTAGAFTNLGRDHLDYHPDVESYFAAKCRLMRDLLPEKSAFVANSSAHFGHDALEVAETAELSTIAIGRDIQVKSAETLLNEKGPVQRLELSFFGLSKSVDLPLPGAFQVENVLTAAGLAVACKLDPIKILDAVSTLKGVPGRLEPVPAHSKNGQIFVDYAHKPDALASALQALRPYANRMLVVVVGAGGDRDPGKRPLMGEVAADIADLVIVTDDNPRSEDPGSIRRQILDAAPRAIEIGDRASAIQKAIEVVGPDDVLLIAGKGHETGQIIGDEVLPFSDQEEVRKALDFINKPEAEPKPDTNSSRSKSALWNLDELEAAIGGRIFGSAPAFITGISIDSRTTEAGDLFFAIKGDRFDGHDFVTKAFRSGAALAVVSEDKLPAMGRALGPLLVVDDVLEALRQLGQAARARMDGQVIAVTGSVGKTSTKEMLALGLGAVGNVHASVKSFNNHWGVPLTLARMPAETEFGIFEIGMNHSAEIEPLTKMVRPHVAMVTTIAPVHLENFDDISGIAAAKAEIFAGLETGGTAILNGDNDFFEFLSDQARANGAKEIGSFGLSETNDARLLEFEHDTDGAMISADVLGTTLRFHMPISGRYLAENAMAVLLAAEAVAADLGAVSEALGGYQLMDGRGARHVCQLQSGTYTLIDESYNANPASMSASIRLMSQFDGGGRRLVVLGDMLELGDDGPELHRSLIDSIKEADVHGVLLCGPLMRSLWDATPENLQVAYAPTAQALLPDLLRAVNAGDTVMIKGSLGSAMAPLVQVLKLLHPPRPSSVDEARAHNLPPQTTEPVA